MANPRNSISFNELGPVSTATFKAHASLTSDNIGDAVTLVSDSTVGVGSSGNFCIGKLIKLETDGFCTVQMGTGIVFSYTSGNAPTVGRGVVVDGAGNVITPAGGSRTVEERGRVVKLNATALTAEVLMI